MRYRVRWEKSCAWLAKIGRVGLSMGQGGILVELFQGVPDFIKT
jgi:hypothetical protein